VPTALCSAFCICAVVYLAGKRLRAESGDLLGRLWLTDLTTQGLARQLPRRAEAFGGQPWSPGRRTARRNQYRMRVNRAIAVFFHPQQWRVFLQLFFSQFSGYLTKCCILTWTIQSWTRAKSDFCQSHFQKWFGSRFWFTRLTGGLKTDTQADVLFWCVSSQWVFLLLSAILTLCCTPQPTRSGSWEQMGGETLRINVGEVCFSPSPEEDMGKHRCVVWISPCKTQSGFCKRSALSGCRVASHAE